MIIRRFSIFVACATVAGTGLYLVREFRPGGNLAGHTAPVKDPVPAYVRALHPKYPYSIIPGGAYSPSELRDADQEDDVVKAHYADFNMKNVKMEQTTEDRYEYASYRMKQKVYWTKKKLRIPKGELLLTDGGSWARARCGNRLSDVPRTPVSDHEPPPSQLSMPPMPPNAPMDLAETPPYSPLSSVPPIVIEQFPPVVAPVVSVTPPPELPPITPILPVVPIAPIVPVIFPPATPPGTPPVTPPTTPVTPTPPVIPPPGPPISSVPEPKAVYLFLVTFVISLYGLSRMVPESEKPQAARPSEEGK